MYVYIYIYVCVCGFSFLLSTISTLFLVLHNIPVGNYARYCSCGQIVMINVIIFKS